MPESGIFCDFRAGIWQREDETVVKGTVYQNVEGAVVFTVQPNGRAGQRQGGGVGDKIQRHAAVHL